MKFEIMMNIIARLEPVADKVKSRFKLFREMYADEHVYEIS